MKNTLKTKQHYKPAYNIIGSYSIKQKDEKDYQDFLLFIEDEDIAKGTYLMNAYRELDKPAWSKYLSSINKEN